MDGSSKQAVSSILLFPLSISTEMSKNLGGKMFDKILLVHTLRDLPSLTILLFGNFDKLFIILHKPFFEKKNFLVTTFF